MFTGSSDGLGYLLFSSSARFMTVDIFAIALIIGLLGYLIDQGIVRLTAMTLRHQHTVSL